ncbi:MAG TPA: hypothetical protein VG433_00330, partial [Pirellulales bacterium]|nr:hypothetical protein [Pirellulales bacterium]
MFALSRKRYARRTPSTKPAKRKLLVQQLEDRRLLTTFAVTNLGDSGSGSLRQAIISADAAHGSETISFSVAGTIQLTSGALPAITGAVDIDGTTAPGFSGTPVVEIDFHHFAGLQFAAGSSGSAVHSLSLADASGAGVSVSAGGVTLLGNYIGLALDGLTADANLGDGVDLNGSSGSTIGGTTALQRNVISANHGSGIDVSGSASNLIEGNYIGTSADGTLNRGNAQNGVLVSGVLSKNNTVGGTAGNVISGNGADGVLLNGNSSVSTVSGNTIGLNAAGNAALGNTLDGVLAQNSNSNLIGQSNPVSSITYANADSVTLNGQPVSAWQGIRAGDNTGEYLIAGTSGNNGLLFDGTMAGVGTSYAVNFPSAQSTSVYGPDNVGSGQLALVGSYRNASATSQSVVVNGFAFQGTTADLSNGSDYQTIDYPGAQYNYVHSTMNGLA